MKILIIGCKTLKKELTYILNKYNISYDVAWIEARLHNVKKKLNRALQEIIDSASGYDTILFSTGFCGNSICGLNSRNSTLIIPRADDCISFLMGGRRQKLTWMDSYFLTEGWLAGEANIWNEYLHSIEKYGKERSDRIFKILFSNYSRVVLLDTGCYPLGPSCEKAKRIADAFSLDFQVIPVSISYLKALVTGPWDKKYFLIIPPQKTITESDLAEVY